MKNRMFKIGSPKRLISLLFISLFCCSSLMAQSAAAAVPIGTTFNYLLFYGFGLVFLGLVVYVLRTAIVQLHENGKTLDLNFIMFKKMSQSGKSVGVVLFLIVLIGIVLAINFRA